MYIYYKPRMWCLCLHQAAWDCVEDDEDVYFCKWCKVAFRYPTKKDQTPVYQKFFP